MIPGNIVKIPEQSEHIIRIMKALLSSGSPVDIAIRVESIIFVFHAVVAVEQSFVRSHIIKKAGDKFRGFAAFGYKSLHPAGRYTQVDAHHRTFSKIGEDRTCGNPPGGIHTCIGSVSDIAEYTVICYQIAHLEIIKCQIFTESITFAEGCVQKGKSIFAFRLKEAFCIISIVVNDFSTERTDQAGNRRVKILIAFQQQWDGGLSVFSSQLFDFFKSF